MSQPAEKLNPGAAATKSPTRPIDLTLAFVVTFFPPIAFVLGVWLWYRGILVPGPVVLVSTVLLYLATLSGVELGYHRLLTHRSYRAKRGLKIALAALGSMGFQGPVIWWSSIHRKHHRYPDLPGDPHSMWVFDPDGKWTWRGVVHAHVGWLWTSTSVGKGGFAHYAHDLYRDRDIFWIHMHYMYFMLAGFVVPTLIGWAAEGTWQGAVSGLLWAGFVRIFFASHLTYWCINSVLHSVGRRPYRTGDHSTNLWVLALFTLGQGWHNNHHACPSSAVMGHRPGEIDPGAWMLRFFRRLGWVDKMVLPSPNIVARKRIAAVDSVTHVAGRTDALP